MLHGIFRCVSEKVQDGCPEIRQNLTLVTQLVVHSPYPHCHQYQVTSGARVLSSAFPVVLLSQHSAQETLCRSMN